MMEFDDDEIDDDGDDAALARIRAAEERIRSTPPRCLEGFALRPSRLKGVVFDGHGEPLNKVYQLACACGHDRFRVLGHHVMNQRTPVFVSPLALECAACGKLTELIDTDVHGYDAELGHGSATIRGTGPRTPFACDTCGVRPMTAHARFEHSSETLEDSTGAFSGNEQNLFTWFSLVGQCDGCGRVLHVADFECA
jgi:hypothetical protein